MKKILVLMLALIVMTSLALLSACGGNDDTTAGTTETTTGTQTTTSEGTVEEFDPNEVITKDENGVSVTSLGDKLVMKLTKTADGEIVYTLSTKEGKTVIGESAMGVTSTNFAGFKNATFKDVTAKELKVSYAHLGTFSTLTDNCIATTVTMENDGYEFFIEIKLYDNGVAFRYNLPTKNSQRNVTAEATTFAVENISKVWYGTNSDCYEAQISGTTYAAIKTSDKLTGPLMIELTDGGYVSLLEGFVQTGSYIGTCYTSAGADNTFKVCGSWASGKDFDAFSTREDIITGWRIINYSTDLGDISTNNNIYHTALGMDGKITEYTDTDWITTGKAMWAWITGRDTSYNTQLKYTEAAIKLGFAYNIIDAGYTNWGGDYESKLHELALLGKSGNVKQVLWSTVTTGTKYGYDVKNEAEAKAIMKKIADLELAGIKLDFFDDESTPQTHAVQTAILKEGMANHLVVNFHGVHKPTAYSVLYPNELTREGIRGLENMSRTDIPNQAARFTRQFYTRLLSGHADFTPDVNTAMQIGSLVVLDSPLMVISTTYDDIMENPAMEMIRAIPTVWDQTVFLDGKIGSYVSLAKEKDGVWYIGGIVSTSGIEAKIDLSKILGDGTYMLTGWVDKTTATKYEKTQLVSKDTVLNLGTLYNGCGYVFRITKLDLSQHGGEITGPITVTTASKDAVVKYTIDGSDPMTSQTAITAGETITLTESALLRIAIVEGDGKGTEMAYQFNKWEYNMVNAEIKNELVKATVTLTSTIEGAKIYYTLDGSTPTTASMLYTEPFTVTESAEIKAISVAPLGNVSAVKDVMVTLVGGSTPDPDPDGTLYGDLIKEKTDIDIVGDAILNGATAGNGMITGITNKNTVSYKLTGNYDGMYELTVWYLSTAKREIRVYVNGVAQVETILETTESLDDVTKVKSHTFIVAMQKGENEIIFTGFVSDGYQAPNIVDFDLTYICSKKPTVTVVAPSSASDDTDSWSGGFAGFQTVKDPDGSGLTHSLSINKNYVTNSTLTDMKAGTYLLTVCGNNADAMVIAGGARGRALKILVNGVAQPVKISELTNSSWNASFSEVTNCEYFIITLEEGENVIGFTAPDDIADHKHGPNLYWYSLTPITE